MEDDAVVEALAGQLLHALDMLRREVGAQRDGDAPVLQVEQHDILERIGRRRLAPAGSDSGKRQRADRQRREAVFMR